MVVVIFELWPAADRTQEYFDIAAQLRAELVRIDGFISIERFESVSNPGKFVSLSFWRDEESVRRWRNTEEHRIAQARGRAGIFADYRLRVATVVRDYSLHTRDEAPADSRDRHDSGAA
jgi:heme-degrading monooxygenase HmoA